MLPSKLKCIFIGTAFGKTLLNIGTILTITILFLFYFIQLAAYKFSRHLETFHCSGHKGLSKKIDVKQIFYFLNVSVIVQDKTS
jgi:hypothetical protein